jgi:hypothetical protein
LKYPARGEHAVYFAKVRDRLMPEVERMDGENLVEMRVWVWDRAAVPDVKLEAAGVDEATATPGRGLVHLA